MVCVSPRAGGRAGRQQFKGSYYGLGKIPAVDEEKGNWEGFMLDDWSGLAARLAEKEATRRCPDHGRPR